MLRLFRFTKLNAARRAASVVCSLDSAADGGVSTFNTSAPISASIIVQNAPGATRTNSSTRIPSSGPAMRFPPLGYARDEHRKYYCIALSMHSPSVALLLDGSNAGTQHDFRLLLAKKTL